MPITFVARHRIIPVVLAAAFVVGATAARTPNTRLPSAAALDDPTIVAIFDAANTWDVETGALAEKKGTTKDVREFGAMLVHDHTMVRQQGRDLAKKLGVHPTPPNDFAMAKDHEAAMKTLRATKGAEFDRAFLQHEVAYHKAVIDAMTQTLLPAIQNQELKDLVTKVAPAFQAHMTAAQQKLDALKSTASR
jgi:putative membrane protein